MTFFGGYVSFQFLATQYFQSLLGWSALETALAFLPAGALVALSSTKVGSVIDRFGTPRVIVAGFVLLVASYVLFLRISLTPAYAAVVLPSMILLGFACALVFPSLNIQATNGVDDDEQGMVSGLLNTSIQVGGAIFLAVVTAVVTASSHDGDASPQAVLDSFRPGLIVVTAIAVAGLLITLTGLRSSRTRKSVVVAKSVPQEAEAQGSAHRGPVDQEPTERETVAARD